MTQSFNVCVCTWFSKLLLPYRLYYLLSEREREREREGGGEKRETDESGRALSGFIFENGQASPAVYL